VHSLIKYIYRVKVGSLLVKVIRVIQEMADKKKSHQNVGRRMKNVEGDGAPLSSSKSLPSGDREKLSREE